ncbi:MAG: hypothetical protein ACE1ZM_08885 [Gammaproteobacteria bacterium]
MEKHLEFKLTPEEANKILSVLGNEPFIKVNQLIFKIQKQAQDQLQDEVKSEEIIRVKS